ncbi:hypothetical protein [uncultured Umboniibacter sp.]|uniref:hypothetical protein n=1 Tax=uncultured Umboniibacter sp. TaxID=1798917 RepID=UPI002611A48C|nr:hypothetical protein [uncultured Umboniibacter sp.]
MGCVQPLLIFCLVIAVGFSSGADADQNKRSMFEYFESNRETLVKYWDEDKVDVYCVHYIGCNLLSFSYGVEVKGHDFCHSLYDITYDGNYQDEVIEYRGFRLMTRALSYAVFNAENGCDGRIETALLLPESYPLRSGEALYQEVLLWMSNQNRAELQSVRYVTIDTRPSDAVLTSNNPAMPVEVEFYSERLRLRNDRFEELGTLKVYFDGHQYIFSWASEV